MGTKGVLEDNGETGVEADVLVAWRNEMHSRAKPQLANLPVFKSVCSAVLG